MILFIDFFLYAMYNGENYMIFSSGIKKIPKTTHISFYCANIIIISNRIIGYWWVCVYTWWKYIAILSNKIGIKINYNFYYSLKVSWNIFNVHVLNAGGYTHILLHFSNCQFL